MKKIMFVIAIIFLLGIGYFNAFQIGISQNSSFLVNIAGKINAPKTPKNAIVEIIHKYKFGIIRDEDTREIVKLLVKYNFPIDERDDKNSDTPLLAIAGSGDIELTKLFLEYGADPNAKTSYATYAHILIFDNDSNSTLKSLQLLHKHGANLCLSDEDNDTVFIKAKRLYENAWSDDYWGSVIEFLKENKIYEECSIKNKLLKKVEI